jgi:hypothetical protein
MNEQYITIDGIKWWVNSARQVQPLCPKHHLRLQWIRSYDNQDWNDRYELGCEECKTPYKLPRGYGREIQYILDKIDAKIFRQAKFINLDDEAIPIAEDKVSSKDNRFFVTSRLMESKTGLRLVVYAGEKGKNKTQIFVEPKIKRLSFDQKDLHPIDVFTKLEATFSDRIKARMEKEK